MTTWVALALLLMAAFLVISLLGRPRLVSPRKRLSLPDASQGALASGLEEVRLTVDVEKNSNPQEVKAILVQAATACPEVLLDPAPQAHVVEQGRDNLKFELVVCRKQRPDSLRGLLNSLYSAIFQAFRRRGVRQSRP